MPNAEQEISEHSMSALFTPLTLRGLTLRNRVAVAPMLQGAAEEGRPTAWHMVHIGRFAIGGFMLLGWCSYFFAFRGNAGPRR